MASRRQLAAALAVAAALRLWIAWRSETISVDGVQYLVAARRFLSGAWVAGLASFYPPGYPLAAAAAYPLAGDWERAGLAVSIAAGVLLLVPLAALGRLAGLSERALAAALLATAIAPWPARYAASVRSEGLYGLLLLGAAWAAASARLRRGGATLAGVAGMVAGLAYLVRPEGVFLVVPLALAVGRRRGAWWVVVAAAAVVLPYVLYLRHDTGHWLISRKAANVLSLGIHEAVGEGGVVSQAASDATPLGDVLAGRGAVLARKLAWDGLRTFGAFAECLHWVPVPFVVIGIIAAARARRPLEPLLHGVVWCFVGLFAAVYVDRRFYTGIVPLALLWGGVGFDVAWRWLAERGRAGAVALAVVLAAVLAGKAVRVHDRAAWVREAGAAIAGAGDPAGVVAARDIRVAWYAGAPWAALEFPLDAARLQPLLDGGARWLVVTEGDLTRDALAALAGEPRAGLRGAVAIGEGRGTARLYCLRCAAPSGHLRGP